MFECGLFHDENGYLCKSESWSLWRSDMIHARIQEFSLGGGGSGPSGIKKLWQRFLLLFSLIFFSPQLILQKSSGYFQRQLPFSKVLVGWTIILEGPTFSRGVQLFFPYTNPYNLWFSVGPDPLPPPPLWIRPCDSAHRGLIYLLGFSLFFFNITSANSFVERRGGGT